MVDTTIDNSSINVTSKDSFPVLVCDIGGTNSRMRLLRMSTKFGVDPIKIDYKRFSTQDYQSLLHLIRTYLDDFKDTENYPIAATVALPGPITDNKIKVIANISHWPHTEGNELAKALKLKHLVLVNDFVVMGYGVTSNLSIDVDLYNITGNQVKEDGVLVVIGAGTGVGHCIGVRSHVSKYHDIIPSEGGHITFAPFNEFEFGYKRYIEEKLKINHVSFERACSGPAIPLMFYYIIESKKLIPKLVDPSDPEYETKRQELSSEAIVIAANNESCPVAIEVRKMFIELLATACSNILLITMPYKGLYLVGSLTIEFQKYIMNSKAFFDRLYHKGRVSEFIKEFPIFIVTDPHIGLKGCQEYARRLIEASN